MQGISPILPQACSAVSSFFRSPIQKRFFVHDPTPVLVPASPAKTNVVELGEIAEGLNLDCLPAMGSS